MSASVAIGEFSRLTHLTVKTLRHYHEQGLLVPYAVDESSGYRRYSVDQVPDALLIGRLRRLEMPLAEVRRVLDSADPAQRDATIADHLSRMEAELSRTRAIVASLRGLLTATVPVEVQRRILPDLAAVAVTARVERDGIGDWCAQIFPQLYARLDGPPTGPGGALYGEEFFTEAVGEVTAYVPVGGVPSTGSGRMLIPGGGYAVAVHAGPFVDFDRTYAALGSHVAAHETAASGPIREIYLISPPETTDETRFRTEVCWPVMPN
ncbi:MAG TPA: MerR family transcriptional regulator [Propionibacteriaceae bacterium]|jgi:DNA-binding transcriptional MerR regulator|nr:MerR family transcriptional regulator [Propionibacteriaceae bacterium]